MSNSENHDPQQVPTGPHELELEILELRPALEAVLMVADQPLDHLTLAQAVGHPPAEVERALADLSAEYLQQGRGFDLRPVAGGWRFFSRAEFASAVERFILEGQQARLTQAALETVAVVAYRQPISRSRISAIRGVNVDGVVRTLVTRGLIEEHGTDAESGALLYRTTSYFLERMGLGGIDELPALAPLLPEVDDPDAYGSDEFAHAAPTPDGDTPDGDTPDRDPPDAESDDDA
ncbi:SMC-Scp complex subunit ScpB [Aeromicrobium sp. CF3.5]|uniref:SMC-Scp complex subunit ScpB n=1 Tax=Aeromicrobium sp. CF3.5 TaxID=3373078 RepID=UPI003EE74CE5